MTNQNKKSFKQVLTKEYKSVIFLTVLVLIIPVILELIQISDLVQLSHFSGKELYQILMGKLEFSYLSNQSLLMIMGIVGLFVTPTLPLIMARLLNGEKILSSVKGALKDYGNKRTWNYIFKVLLPMLLFYIAMYVLITLIPSSSIDTLIVKLAGSLPLSIFTLILTTIIVVLIITISNIVLIANIAYMRGTERIKDIFKAIPSREINKLVIFNMIDVIIMVAIIIIYFKYIAAQSVLTLLLNVWKLLITFKVIILIPQIIMGYLRIALYYNVASKVPFNKNEMNVFGTSQSVQTTIELNGQSEVVNLGTANTELSIKPKSAKRPNRLNPNNPFKVKR